MQERQNRKSRFKFNKNVTIFAALLKNIPMGRPESIFPEILKRDSSVNCLLSNKDKQPYKHHLCLLRALARYMNGYKDSLTSRYST